MNMSPDDPGHGFQGMSVNPSVHSEPNVGGQMSVSPEMSLPMSASSSSTSSNPLFAWPAHPSLSSGPLDPRIGQEDPFNNTNSFAEDPFAHPIPSSESDDDLRGSRQSSVADETSVHESATREPIVVLPIQFRAASLPVDQLDHPIGPEHIGRDPSLDEFPFEVDTQVPPPAFNRTFSAPLPSRLGHLQHPIVTQQRSSMTGSVAYERNSTKLAATGQEVMPNSTTSDSSPLSDSLQTPLHTISLELADSLQSAIQTLLHLSPPHLLDNAKEQYSGCTVQMPTTSLSALLTSMRSLNYLSANIENLCAPQATKPQSSLMPSNQQPAEDFDIGELLQSVADLLSGQLAQSGVDLVLFHGDVDIKHISVTGDGQGLGYLLSHIIRQILLVATPGDTVELGLLINPQSPSSTPRTESPPKVEDVATNRTDATATDSHSPSPGRTFPQLPPNGPGGPVLCMFEIIHNICQSAESPGQTPKAELNPFTHLKEQSDAAEPKLDSLLCRRLLQQQRASLKVDPQPPLPAGTGSSRRLYELTILLSRGRPISEPTLLSAEEEAVRQPFSSVRLAREPTLAELSQFAESLRGKKVVLHASLNSVFARHLTSYLSAWGLDVSHAVVEEANRPGRTAFPAEISEGPDLDSVTAAGYRTRTPGGTFQSMKTRAESFIIIDDDVGVLRRELSRLRAETQPALKTHLSKRPALLNRAKSTSHVRQVSTLTLSDQIIIHFTSLTNFNQVRDVVSGLLGPPWATRAGALLHPDVMVVPKPVGPRRFLTALHTAVFQPVIDPFFAPIATSPRSPGGGYFGNIRTPTGSEPVRAGGFFDVVGEEGERSTSESGGSRKARSPLGEIPPSQPIMPNGGGLHLAIPTPGDILATPASEYFSSTRGSANAASGIVMQSPDGRPFGMFFEPPPKIENRRGSIGRIPSDAIRRKNTGRRPSGSTRGEESVTNGSPSVSPQQHRRISTAPLSTSNADDTNALSRRSSGVREVDPKAAVPASSSVRPAVRRSTLPANGAEPILAIGRDRSSTVTSRKRITPATTPVALSPKTIASPQMPARNTPEVLAASPAPSTKLGLKRRSRLVERSDDDGVVVPPINVLIVEDNPINQNILAMFLRKKKIKYQSAKDGLEAVEKWRTGGFHLILMDIQLPVMDGIDATKEIRKLERTNNIGVFPSTPSGEPGKTLAEVPAASPFRSSVIIVALTASSLQSDRVAALAAGCNDFLTKPVSLKWLERKIVEWGCMQALIDFDGWRRWHSSDGRDANETKRGFQVGPQQAARNLASRLRIERKHNRSPGPIEKVASQQPAINVQIPTPDADRNASVSDSTVLQAAYDPQPDASQTSASGQKTLSKNQATLPRSMSLMSIHEDVETAPNVKTATLPDLQA